MFKQRRSSRHLLGARAEVHVGPVTTGAEVVDVSPEGMGLRLPPDVTVRLGEVVWIVVEAVSTYAITATVRWTGPSGRVGVELHEVLAGDALARVEQLPLAEVFAPTDEGRAPPEPDAS